MKRKMLIPTSSFYYEDNDRLLDEAINEAKSYDVISHLLQPRYRSHYIHSFLVGALGWWMLQNVKFEDNYLGDCYEKFIQKRYSGRGYDLWDIWWSVAILHDVGYPVSLFLKRIELFCSLSYNYPGLGTSSQINISDKVILSNIIESLLSSSFKGELSKNLLCCLKLFLTNMTPRPSLSDRKFKKLTGELFRAVYEELRNSLDGIIKTVIRDNGSHSGKSLKDKLVKYNNYSKSSKKVKEFVCQFDHGVMSTIIASQFIGAGTLDRWKGDPIPDLIFSPIAFHGLKNVGREKITCEIKEDSDIFFLRLVDQIQEWNRGILSDKRDEILIESKRIKIGPFTNKEGGPKYIDLEKMEIVFEMSNIDVLLKTGWSFEEFLNDKKSSFKLLELAGRKFEPKLKIEII